MTISLPTALALLALVVAGFAVLAVFGVYARLKHVERALADVTFGDVLPSVPDELRPRGDLVATVILVLNGECPTCHHLATAVETAAAAGGLDRLRLIRMFSSADALDTHEPSTLIETCTDPDLWTAVYEGYAPTVAVADAGGRVLHRRFVYPDTDLVDLVRDLPSRAGLSTHSTASLAPREAS